MTAYRVRVSRKTYESTVVDVPKAKSLGDAGARAMLAVRDNPAEYTWQTSTEYSGPLFIDNELADIEEVKDGQPSR